MILGLDISTSITGATVLDDVGKVLYCESWDMRNKNHFPSPFVKADFVKNSLLDLTIAFRIEHIFVEQSLQAFRPGFSSAKTLLTLAKFNGIVSYICFSALGLRPEYIGASTARKSCGIRVPKGEKAKEVALKFLLDNEKDFIVECTKHGNPKPQYYDQADALVMARAGLTCLKENSGS